MDTLRVVSPADPERQERLRRTFAAVTEMERNGVYIDVDLARWLRQDAVAQEGIELDGLRPWWDEHGWVDREDARSWTGPGAPWNVDDVWSSGQKLSLFLHSKMGINLPCSPFWKKGQVKLGADGWPRPVLKKGKWTNPLPKTDAAALEYLAGQHPEHREGLLRLIRLRRERGVIQYLTKWPTLVSDDGLLHPVFGPIADDDDRVGALTGRLGCKSPELQQAPTDKDKDVHRIRRIFRARRGEVILVADYSALEVVILAQILLWLFDDADLARMVAPGATDIHAFTAHYVFRVLGDPVANALSLEDFTNAAKKEKWTAPFLPPAPRDFRGTWNEAAAVAHCGWLRLMVKRIRYGLNYGKGAWGFGSTLFTADGSPLGEERAQAMIDALMKLNPAVLKFFDWVHDWIDEHGGIPSLDGRWCDLAGLVDGDDWQRARAWRRALNYPMQAGGADLVNEAMYLVAFDPRLRAMGFVLILQVHDELVLRGPERHAAEAAAVLKEIMTSVGLRLFPGRWTLPLQVSVGWAHSWEDAK